MAIVLPKFPRRRAPAGSAAEAQPAVNVALCREDGRYEAGGQLAARWRIRNVPIKRTQGLEVSVLWHTEGKGDEDLHVHHFHRLSAEQLRRIGLDVEQSLECRLPATPLSYHGQLITLRWCIRLRLFLEDGREVVTEHPFYLVSPGVTAGVSSPKSPAPRNQADRDAGGGDNRSAIAAPQQSATPATAVDRLAATR